MSTAWHGGSTRRWRTIRANVLRRDGGRCQLAYPGTWHTRGRQDVHCLITAGCVHHKHGKGRCWGCAHDAPDHLEAACTPCNLKAGEPGAGAGLPRPKTMTRW